MIIPVLDTYPEKTLLLAELRTQVVLTVPFYLPIVLSRGNLGAPISVKPRLPYRKFILATIYSAILGVPAVAATFEQ